MYWQYLDQHGVEPLPLRLKAGYSAQLLHRRPSRNAWHGLLTWRSCSCSDCRGLVGCNTSREWPQADL